MNQSVSTQVLALSALCLAVRAVQQIARGEGAYDGQELYTTVAEA